MAHKIFLLLFWNLDLPANVIADPSTRKDCELLKAFGPRWQGDIFCPVLMPEDHPKDSRYWLRTDRMIKVIRVLIKLFYN